MYSGRQDRVGICQRVVSEFPASPDSDWVKTFPIRPSLVQSSVGSRWASRLGVMIVAERLDDGARCGLAAREEFFESAEEDRRDAGGDLLGED